jgi:hypothetical protein
MNQAIDALALGMPETSTSTLPIARDRLELFTQPFEILGRRKVTLNPFAHFREGVR